MKTDRGEGGPLPGGRRQLGRLLFNGTSEISLAVFQGFLDIRFHLVIDSAIGTLLLHAVA